jgi:hypothetical protein
MLVYQRVVVKKIFEPGSWMLLWDVVGFILRLNDENSIFVAVKK